MLSLLPFIETDFLEVLWDILDCEFRNLNFDLVSEDGKFKELSAFLSESQKNIEFKVIKFIVSQGQSLWNLNLLSTFYDELLSPSVETEYISKIKSTRFEGTGPAPTY